MMGSAGGGPSLPTGATGGASLCPYELECPFCGADGVRGDLPGEPCLTPLGNLLAPNRDGQRIHEKRRRLLIATRLTRA